MSPPLPICFGRIISALHNVSNIPELRGHFGKDWESHINNSIAWCHLLKNDISQAETYLKKALTLNRQNMYAWGNFGLIKLLKGDTESALEIFRMYKRGDKLYDGSKWIDLIANDLNLLERKGLFNENFSVVRKELKIKN